MKLIEEDRYAYYFSNNIIPMARMKAFFITEDGYIGTAPHSIAVNDHVVLVCGAPHPLVLRKQDSGNFRLLGPAFVRGAMHGEAWLKDESDLEEFTII
jgi:hypothetical protein